MKRFKVIDKTEKKYRNVDICEALGVSTGAISGFMQKAYGASSKGGMTIEQIIEFINTPHKEKTKQTPNKNEVRELMEELYKRGIVIDEEEQLTF